MASNIIQTEQVNSGFPGSALTLMGNAPNNAGPGVILDNGSVATSGSVVSFRSGGVELASIDYAGNLHLSGSITPGTGTLTLIGSATAAGPGIIAENMTTLTSGDIIQFKNGGSTQLYIDFEGNLSAQGTVQGVNLAATGYVQSPYYYGSGNSINLNGQAGATGIGAILNNDTTLTSGGKIASFQNNGVEKVNIDYAGNLQIDTGYLQTSNIYGSGSSLTLYGQATASGPGIIIQNQTTLSSGNITEFMNGSTSQLSIAYNGHIIPPSSGPTVASFHANFGTVTGSGVTGGDLAGIITFTTGTASSIGANSALSVVTIADAYGNSQYAIMVSYAQATGALDVTAFYAVPTSAGTFTIYNVSAITPSSSTTYKLQFMTIGAGATY